MADDLISLRDASRLCPGRPPHLSVIWRWARVGLKARTGHRIKLRHCRVGARLFTTAVWLREFFEELAEEDAKYFERPAPAEAPSPTQRRSLCQRDRDVAAADARLAARGA